MISHSIFCFWNRYRNLSLMSSSAPFAYCILASQSMVVMMIILLEWQIEYDDTGIIFYDNLAKTENIKCSHYFWCCNVYWAVISLVGVATLSNQLWHGGKFSCTILGQLHSLQLFEWSSNNLLALHSGPLGVGTFGEINIYHMIYVFNPIPIWSGTIPVLNFPLCSCWASGVVAFWAQLHCVRLVERSLL